VVACGYRTGPSATTTPWGLLAESGGDRSQVRVGKNRDHAVAGGAVSGLCRCVFQFAEGETGRVDHVVGSGAEEICRLVDAGERAHETYQPSEIARRSAPRVAA